MIPESPWPVSNAVYHATRFWMDDDGKTWPLVSSSTLKRWRACPGPLALSVGSGKDSDALSFGQAMHAFWLDGSPFSLCGEYLPKAKRAALSGMVLALLSAPPGTHAHQVMRFFKPGNGRSEWSYVWQHASGVCVKIRVDRLVDVPDGPLINFDLKTSHAFDVRGFIREAERFGYYHQAALYEDGIRVAFPGQRVYTRWGFQSKRPPYRVWCPTPDPVKLERARVENDAALHEIAALYLDPEGWVAPLQDWERVTADAVPIA